MKKIAIVAPLLPETTGIAEFTERVFKGRPEVDLFWKESNYSFGIDKIFKKTIDNNYSHLIFTLGNSNHNLPTFNLLKIFEKFPGRKTKLGLHIHDPVLTNIASQVYGPSGPTLNYLEYYRQRDGIRENITCMYRGYEHYGYSGLASIVSRHNISSIITHSKSAEKIVLNDLGEALSSRPQYIQLFHPCFESVTNVERGARKYDVGLFGVLDNGGKMSNKVLNVIHHAISNKIVKKCVLCGYNAMEYARSNGIDVSEYLEIIENPTHEDMFRIMCNTRIAIQPRLINCGESSGIIPMLIAANVDIITSNVGSFAEFSDDLVLKVENNDFEDNCYRGLISLLPYLDKVAARRQFVEFNSPNRFVDLFVSTLE